MQNKKGERNMKKKVVNGILCIAILFCSLLVFVGTASSLDLKFKVSIDKDLRAAPLSVWPNGWFYYSPSEIQLAYNLNPLYEAGYDGSGQTIVIVDAYASPYTYQDLQLFDQVFGLPDPPSFTMYYPTGIPDVDWEDPGVQNWAIETSLDVQWAHAIAPGADIALVVAASSYTSDMNPCIAYAVSNELGSVISQSFGIQEPWLTGPYRQIISDMHNSYVQAANRGITVLASTGDYGSNGYPLFNFNSVSHPASDPYVTAVGGTSLYMELDTDGVGTAYSYETVWEEAFLYGNPANPYLYYAGTGGGVSMIFSIPNYQKEAGIKVTEVFGSTYKPKGRAVPDVSYNAGVYTSPVLCFVTIPYDGDWGTWIFWIGGTSAGAPQWAGIVAIANQMSTESGGTTVGFMNPKLYNLYTRKHGAEYVYDFNDVELDDPGFPYGNTGWYWADPSTYPYYSGATPVLGYEVTAGWDACTGLGTPNAAYLVPGLVALSH
jgi:subtilase family serine protease